MFVESKDARNASGKISLYYGLPYRRLHYSYPTYEILCRSLDCGAVKHCNPPEEFDDQDGVFCHNSLLVL